MQWFTLQNKILFLTLLSKVVDGIDNIQLHAVSSHSWTVKLSYMCKYAASLQSYCLE